MYVYNSDDITRTASSLDMNTCDSITLIFTLYRPIVHKYYKFYDIHSF